MLPHELHARPAERFQFITAQHWQAWRDRTPLRRHIPGRKKIDRDLREIVYRERGRKCEQCGRTDYLTVDHIIPVELGGATNSQNARVLGEPHNRAAWAPFRPYLKLLDAYLKAVA
jgi:5-methylcytosine-specific restriction endonuclease McrA